jgi:hypothetical protein
VAGSPLTVAFSSPDRSVTEAILELSPDGGRTWVTYAELTTPTLRISVPDKEGRYHLRAAARDASGRSIRSQAIQFDAIVGVDDVRIATHASAAPGKLVPVVFEPRHLLRTAKELRLEISPNGTDWTKVADVRANEVQFTAPKVEGTYVLRLWVVMPDGKEYASKPANLKVESKGFYLANFRGGESVVGGKKKIIVIKTDRDLVDVLVDLSLESGKEGSWKRVPVEDLQPTQLGWFWDIPQTATKSARLRISVKGTTLSDQSDSDFTIEGPGGAAQVVPPTKGATDPVRVVPTAPQGAPRLDSPIPALMRGGSTVELRWTTADPAAKVKAIFVQGDQAVLIAENQAASGSLVWTTPKADLRDCAVILEAAGKQSRSAPFTLDSSVPLIDAVDIKIPRR